MKSIDQNLVVYSGTFVYIFQFIKKEGEVPNQPNIHY